jgi:aspartate kinase
MIVMKFGGTSLGDAGAFLAARDRIRERWYRAPVVVASASSGVTSSLLAAISEAAAGSLTRAVEIITGLSSRHQCIAEEVLSPRTRDGFLSCVAGDCRTLKGILGTVADARTAPSQSVDRVASVGEQWSSTLLHALLVDSDIPAELVPATELLITDDQFTRANPDIDESSRRIRSRIASFRTHVIVTQGFIGSTAGGRVTTIGRGGSDFSAAIIGSALDAEEIEIWKDVNGVLSADPAVVPDAVPISDMTYEEHVELSHYGAKVLHPSTFLPAKLKEIPLRVLNSSDPTFPGTVIRAERAGDVIGRITSITSRRGTSVVSLPGRRDSTRRTLAAELIHGLAARGREIEFLVSSEAGVSFVSDAGEEDLASLGHLTGGGQISLRNHRAMVCLVGDRIRKRRDVGSDAYAALAKAGITIDHVFDGVSEHSLVLLLDEDRAADAVRILHRTFFGATVSRAPLSDVTAGAAV